MSISCCRRDVPHPACPVSWSTSCFQLLSLPALLPGTGDRCRQGDCPRPPGLSCVWSTRRGGAPSHRGPVSQYLLHPHKEACSLCPQACQLHPSPMHTQPSLVERGASWDMGHLAAARRSWTLMDLALVVTPLQPHPRVPQSGVLGPCWAADVDTPQPPPQRRIVIKLLGRQDHVCHLALTSLFTALLPSRCLLCIASSSSWRAVFIRASSSSVWLMLGAQNCTH